MKVLIADKINETAFGLFGESHIDYDYKPEIDSDSLLATIALYEGLLIRGRSKATRTIVDAGVNLRVIGRVGSGVDNIDIAACKTNGIKVVNARAANSQSVAELTIALIITLARRLDIAFSSMKSGEWLKNTLAGHEIFGRTVGIIGYGEVGRKVDAFVSKMGAFVIYHSRKFQTTTFREIFEKSDIVTLHLSLNSETKGCVKRDVLSLMKPTAYLINTSRAEIIEEEALFAVLSEKKIAGAAIDVFWEEPLPAASRWRLLDNVILTPHIGAATKEALEKASFSVVSDCITILHGGRGKYEVVI